MKDQTLNASNNPDALNYSNISNSVNSPSEIPIGPSEAEFTRTIPTNKTKDVKMKWITRSHVHVDRVACPWLITRFIDSAAQFLFAPKDKVLEIARQQGAIPFDTPGAELHHQEDLCTFDVIIKKYNLTDKALLRLAKIVNAADTNRLGNDPLAAGLEAIAVGYSLRFPDDLKNLAEQFDVYDALYAWCRLDTAKGG